MRRLEDFTYYLNQQNIRQVTIGKHLHSLKYIYASINTLDVAPAKLFLLSLKEQGRTATYINILIASLRHYGKFLGDESYKTIKYFRTIDIEKGVLSDKEITAFLAITPDAIKHVDKEMFALFSLFFKCLAFSGLRPNELMTMRVQQCDLGSRLFRLGHDTKTHTPRVVPISDALIPELEKHLKTLTSDRLFPQWDRHKWKRQFNMRIRYLGIKRDNISTYSLRHSWITRLLDEGANPHVMADMAGHTLEQQAHYYHLTSKSKHTAIQKDTLARKTITKQDRLLQGRKALEDLGLIVYEAKAKGKGFMYVCTEE